MDFWGNTGFVTALPWQQAFKYTNTFSFTEPQHPWINHEWLSEYILHTTAVLFGGAGLLLLKCVLGLCVIFMIYLAMRESAKSGALKFLFLLLVISTMGYGFSTRPHLFTYLLYTFFLLALWRFHRYPGRNRHLFWLAPLGAIWANLHGAFFIGALLLALYIIFSFIDKSRDKILQPAITLVLFIAAAFINPYGAKLWNYIFFSAQKARPYLSEWAPFINPAYFSEHIDFVFLSLIAFFAVWFSKKKKDAAWLGILSVSFLSAILMRRNIPLFAITAAFVVPGYLDEAVGEPLDRIFSRLSRPLLIALLCIFTAVSAVYTVTFNKKNPLKIEIPNNWFPVAAVSFMKQNNISGNALVFFDWAEYSILELYPKCRVFMDGRFCSAYSLKTMDDYMNFLYCNEGWANALNNYPTNIVLMDKRAPVYEKMLSLQGWTLVYNDEISGLFLKKKTK